ncbi:MAG: hypothetical protein EHM93_03495 [Bacteroidales bacterium]|nr:MAG: hypothetical protein EHM93_03495 [Bacteroidales bacterium]
MAITLSSFRKRLLLTGIFAFISLVTVNTIIAYSDSEDKFSGDIQKFPTELNDILKKDSNPVKEQLLKDFTKFWTVDSVLTDEQKTRIVAVSTTMLNKTLNSKNHFFTYVELIMFFWRDDYAKGQYPGWEECFLKIVNKEESSIGVINDFLNVSLSTISKNILNERGGYFWKVSKPNYRFIPDNEISIKFDSTTLICSNVKDSFFIKATQGVYYPLTKKWVGNGGKVTWARSKYPENEIFAKLQKYRINLNENNYKADSVYFTNKDYFDNPTLGQLTDWLIKDYKPDNIPYPEFQSYDQWFNIKNLFDNIDYEGGFTMRGSKLIGTGGRSKLATIIVKRNDKEFLRVEGNILIFQRQIINSEKARVRFKFDSDSLFHVGLSFTYSDKNKTVSITSTEKLLTQSPFNSSYHKLSITANQLSWKITDDKILFGGSTVSSLNRATFESDNFFNEQRFDYMMGPDEKHPLLALANYAKKVRSKFFLAEDMASFLRKSIEQVRVEMMKIAVQGYIYYDFNTDEIQITPKLYDAIKARGQLIDYDVINFNSQTLGNTPNASLDLKTMDLLINGIENISISDSQNVKIYPSKQQIVMKKDRNFSFGGAVRSGLFLFQGKKFNFDYANFKIGLEDVISLNLDYKTKQYDMTGQRVLSRVTNTFEQIKGDILIDKPDNKSGLKKNKGYPLFNSTATSYIYYDDPNIFGGVYKRDSFYFEVFPFKFSNLNNFEPADMNFTGILHSSNILAPITDTLRLRPDNSLGFVRITPPEGFALYQGKGKVFNKIDLSNEGLRANGQVKYITSTTTSDDFYLFPDSMITKSTIFTIEQQLAGIQYPETKGVAHNIKWYPKQEKFYAYKGEQSFAMYNNQARLNGDLLLGPLGLTGDGTTRLDNAKLVSAKYEFNANDFITDSTSLDLYVPGSDSVSFETIQLKAKIDFLTRQGLFNKNGVSIFAKMQPLRYETHLDKFIWNLDNNDLSMSTGGRQGAVEVEKFHISNMADRDSIPSGSVFYSTRFDEDSLYFFAPMAKYNLKNSSLNADSVKYILVADAAIYPIDKKITIEPLRRILPIDKSVVSASIPKRYHKIYNADVLISSRKKYSGKGLYDYIDERDSVETITLTEIGVNESHKTFGNGAITEPDSFKLSPEFGFIGKVALNAPDKFLYFNGGARPIFKCYKLNPNAVKFEALINPDSILIPISETPQNINFAKLINGSIITEDSIKLYGSILGIRKDYDDTPFVLASGYMNFNKINRRFTIGPAYKIFNPDTSGNTVSLQKDFCMMFGEGKIVLPIELGQVKLKANGNIIHKLEDNTITLDAILQINFFFSQKALEAMATELNSYAMLDKVDLSRKIVRKTLFENVEPKNVLIALSQISLFGAPTQVPSGFESTITLADVKLKWNQRTRSFISSGKIGIGTIGNIQVNKRVNGFIEIVKRRSGDFMTLYIHLGDDKYYVFSYTKGAMQVSSSNDAFVAPIKLLKASDRKVKVPLGQQKYNYLIGTNNTLNTARERYKQLQMGDDNSDVLNKMEKSSSEEEEKEKKETTTEVKK